MKTVLVRYLREFPSGVRRNTLPAAFYNKDVPLHSVVLLRHSLQLSHQPTLRNGSLDSTRREE